MQFAFVLIIACGLAALAYGYVAAREVLAADAGIARMQEIAAAIQEGAKAYLNRQYTAVAVVGLVIMVLLVRHPAAASTSRIGFVDRRDPFGRSLAMSA